jgi:hypothetical protein
MGADAGPIRKRGGIERYDAVDVAQAAEPEVIDAHQVDDLVADRAMGITGVLDELVVGERRDVRIPHVAVLGEVVAVEMTESISIHAGTIAPLNLGPRARE